MHWDLTMFTLLAWTDCSKSPGASIQAHNLTRWLLDKGQGSTTTADGRTVVETRVWLEWELSKFRRFISARYNSRPVRSGHSPSNPGIQSKMVLVWRVGLGVRLAGENTNEWQCPRHSEAATYGKPNGRASKHLISEWCSTRHCGISQMTPETAIYMILYYIL